MQESFNSIPPHERRQLLLDHDHFTVTSIHIGGTLNTAHRLFNSSTRSKSSLNTILISLLPRISVSPSVISHTVRCQPQFCPPIHFHCDPTCRKQSLIPSSSASSTVAST